MIYHLLTVNQYETQFNGIYYGQELLKSSDFLHCCTKSQILKVLETYYPKEDEVLAFEILEEKLESKYLYEKSGKSDEVFPHIYGQINKDAVNRIIRLKYDTNGFFSYNKM